MYAPLRVAIGWRVQLDGRGAAIRRCQGAFQGSCRSAIPPLAGAQWKARRGEVARLEQHGDAQGVRQRVRPHHLHRRHFAVRSASRQSSRSRTSPRTDARKTGPGLSCRFNPSVAAPDSRRGAGDSDVAPRAGLMVAEVRVRLAAPSGGFAAEIASDNVSYQTRMALGCFLLNDSGYSPEWRFSQAGSDHVSATGTNQPSASSNVFRGA